MRLNLAVCPGSGSSSPGRSEAVFFCQEKKPAPMTESDDTSSKKDRCQRHSMFFEDFFDPLTKWKRSFSFLNLRLQTSDLVSFHHSSFCSFSFRR